MEDVFALIVLVAVATVSGVRLAVRAVASMGNLDDLICLGVRCGLRECRFTLHRDRHIGGRCMPSTTVDRQP